MLFLKNRVHEIGVGEEKPAGTETSNTQKQSSYGKKV
jgi:hypothetical protein